MNISDVSSLGSSHQPPITSQIKKAERDFKRAEKSHFPRDVLKTLPFPETPWKINPEVFFKYLQFPASPTDEVYRMWSVAPIYPEWKFVKQLFEHSCPPNLAIGRITCVHNPTVTRAFETNLSLIAAEARNPSFAPKIEKDKYTFLRKRALNRWRKTAREFTNFQLEVTSRKTQKLTKTYIFPLWHATDPKNIQSIAFTGLAFFGKHAFKQDKVGDERNTDIGFYGSGIYCTDSVECASEYSKECMVLSWVAMREPYMVVADRTPLSFEDEPHDKTILKGQGPYGNYNAHCIPVKKVRPPGQKAFDYPCPEGQIPDGREFVVFNKQQVLPRFIIQLVVDLPRAPSLSLEHACKAFLAKLSSRTRPFMPNVSGILRKALNLGIDPSSSSSGSSSIAHSGPLYTSSSTAPSSSSPASVSSSIEYSSPSYTSSEIGTFPFSVSSSSYTSSLTDPSSSSPSSNFSSITHSGPSYTSSDIGTFPFSFSNPSYTSSLTDPSFSSSSSDSSSTAHSSPSYTSSSTVPSSSSSSSNSSSIEHSGPPYTSSASEPSSSSSSFSNSSSIEYSPSSFSSSLTAGLLRDKLLELLNRQILFGYPELVVFLSGYLQSLPDNYDGSHQHLSSEDIEIYRLITLLVDQQGKIDNNAAKNLLSKEKCRALLEQQQCFWDHIPNHPITFFLVGSGGALIFKEMRKFVVRKKVMSTMQVMQKW